jgi:hypothetical protein
MTRICGDYKYLHYMSMLDVNDECKKDKQKKNYLISNEFRHDKCIKQFNYPINVFLRPIVLSS